MACIFLFLSPRSVSLFEKIETSFWNLFLNRIKSPPFRTLVWIWIFKPSSKISRFEKPSKRLFNFMLVWSQIKFSLKLFENLWFESKKPWINSKTILLQPVFNLAHSFIWPVCFLSGQGPSCRSPSWPTWPYRPSWPLSTLWSTEQHRRPSIVPPPIRCAITSFVTDGRAPTPKRSWIEVPYVPPPFPSSSSGRVSPRPLCFESKSTPMIFHHRPTVSSSPMLCLAAMTR
jgi:hypothetical protein